MSLFVTEHDVDVEFKAGLWVPDRYATRFVLCKKDARFPVTSTQLDWKREPYEHTYYTQQDTSAKYLALEDAQEECDRRNAADTARTAIAAATGDSQ